MPRFTIVVAMLLSSLAYASGDVDAGKAAFALCTTCHGQQGEGNAALNAPKLSGQPAWYLARQLHNYKNGIRAADDRDVFGKQMQPMAMVLTDDAAVDNVVAYIGTLPDTPAPVTVQGDSAKGKTLYATCAACHGPDGMGLEALNAPRQAGIDDWYLVRQLKNFKTGIRGKDAKDIYGIQMAPMAAILADDQAINDIVAYINTLGK